MEELVELIINPNTREFGIRLLSDTLGLEEVRKQDGLQSAMFVFKYKRKNLKTLYKFLNSLRPYFKKYNIIFSAENTALVKSPDFLRLSIIFYGLKQ